MHLIFTIQSSTEINVIIDSCKSAPRQTQRLHCQSVELMHLKLLFPSTVTIIKLLAFVQSLVNYDQHVKLT